MGDYDRKPMDPPSQWLRLKSKNEKARLRIASSPYRELKVWPAADRQPPLEQSLVDNLTPGQWATLMRDPDFNINEVYHFAVIDRADGAAKVFTTTGGVYGKIRKFATDPEWGDPKSYDLTVIRTEQPGKNYYEVTPSPNKSDLTALELDKIDKLNIQAKLPGAVPASETQPDDIDPDTTPEPLPWAKQEPTARPAAAPQQALAPEPAAPSKPDVVIEDISDEPINLDDIPF